MTDDIQTVDAAKALGDVGETPRVTNTIPVAAAPVPDPSGLRDNNGVAFDPLLHEAGPTGPRMRGNGSWALKRGNGARRAKGLPPSGAVSFAVLPPKPRTEEPPPAAGAAPSPAPQPSPAPAGGAQIVHEATIETNPVLVEADYENTAKGVQRGLFAVAKLRFGPAWEPDDAERTEWVGCLRRLWHHYQLPRIGILAEFVVLTWSSISKRREDAKTLEGWAKLKCWLGIKPTLAVETETKPNA